MILTEVLLCIMYRREQSASVSEASVIPQRGSVFLVMTAVLEGTVRNIVTVGELLKGSLLCGIKMDSVNTMMPACYPEMGRIPVLSRINSR